MFTQYIMTKRIIARMDGQVVCATCLKPIKPKQKVVSISRRNSRSRRHEECAKRVGII